VGQAELLIAGLLVAVAGLSWLARLLNVPYPVMLVVGGALFGFIPGVPKVRLDPNVVLVVFLPPLIYGAAVFANLNDMRSNLRSLSMVAIGLVLLTMCSVAVVAHEVINGLPWSAAFTLGAIVPPTDPLAGALIMRRLGLPRRLVSGIEGEGLFNDSTALVAYKVAIAAVVSGSFSLSHAGLKFLADAAGGIAIGLAVAAVIWFIRRRTTDAQISITISLLSGYAAFIPADQVGASGVLAAATCGIFLGFRLTPHLPPRIRLQGVFVWDILDFIINATLFVLVGLQVRTVVQDLSGQPWATFAGYALAVTGVVVVTRIVWFFTMPYLVRALDRRPQQRLRRVGAAPRFVLAWAGMRGAVSLAAALALPLTTHGGQPFPQRNLLVFLTFSVIFGTLVLQGLTLPGVIRLLGVTGDGSEDNEELKARLVATKAALAQIDELSAEEWTRDDTVERMRNAYEYRKRRLAARAGKIEDDGYEDRSLAYQQMIQIVLEAQRRALVQMRNDRQLSNDTLNRIVQELDLEESRLEI
jgi:monovalent cation/hydrogen antiporter